MAVSQGLGRQLWHARRDRVTGSSPVRLRLLSPSRRRGAIPGGHEGVWICRQREIAEHGMQRCGLKQKPSARPSGHRAARYAAADLRWGHRR